ncbi:MAG TPA: SOS response-associated peptidase [Gemmatimonadaceae bacterium]
MCGRSSLHDAPVSILERYNLPPVIPGFTPRYNICPTQEQFIILIDDDGAPAARGIRWGLIPSWARDASNGARNINARAESLADRPSWEIPLRSRRCLVLADGYYEWTGTGKSRVPWFFHMTGNKPFVMAGLWDRWSGNGAPLDTCTIITTQAGPRMSQFHHRVPVIFPDSAADMWLNSKTSVRDALSLLSAYENDDLQCHEVSRYVNSPANDSPDCITRVDRLL